MELQDRDFEILKFCLEQKFATLLQMGKMFFPESRDIFHRPVKRVCELVNEGLLKAEQLRVCEKKLYVKMRLNGPGSVHFADLWEESESEDESDPFDDMRKDDAEYGAIV